MKKEAKSLEDILLQIGNNLYTIRHVRRDKIATVARAIGVSHPVISLVENGRYKSINIALLYRLATYYKVPLGYILSDGADKSIFDIHPRYIPQL